jgi:hypothetical protein
MCHQAISLAFLLSFRFCSRVPAKTQQKIRKLRDAVYTAFGHFLIIAAGISAQSKVTSIASRTSMRCNLTGKANKKV